MEGNISNLVEGGQDVREEDSSKRKVRPGNVVDGKDRGVRGTQETGLAGDVGAVSAPTPLLPPECRACPELIEGTPLAVRQPVMADKTDSARRSE